MAIFMKNLGLSGFLNSEESLEDFLFFAAQEGKPLEGCSGNPYFNYHLGDAQIILRTRCDSPGDINCEFTGFDTHYSGGPIWTLQCEGSTSIPASDLSERRCIFTCPDTAAEISVDIVNADVLPGYYEGDMISMRTAAFPLGIDYSKPVGEQKTILTSNPDGTTIVSGIVESVRWGKAGQAEFLITRIDTDFGPLDLVHSPEQVKVGQEDLVTEGSKVYARVVISGDVAVDKH